MDTLNCTVKFSVLCPLPLHMISDQDVIHLFSKASSIQLDLTDTQVTLYKGQIFRGMPRDLRENVHPRGCRHNFNIFNKFNVIPKDCFDCFKVCIALRNVVELFKLLMIFERIALPLDNIRKCMVEVRSNCSGTYKGLIYCLGIEEGNEICKIAKKVVSEDISPHVSVTLKRGCSEFEHVYPEFARVEQGRVFMQYVKDWQDYEDIYDKDIVITPHGGNPHIRAVNANGRILYTKSDICGMQLWLRYAATIGDMSYLTIAGKTMPPIPDLNRQFEAPRS